MLTVLALNYYSLQIFKLFYNNKTTSSEVLVKDWYPTMNLSFS